MSAIEKMKGYCEEKSLKDITIWKPNPAKNGTLEPPEAVENVLCPNQCSGNGVCVNGTCECNTGFQTTDCSMMDGELPIVSTKWPMSFDGLCDMRRRDCSRIRVAGYNFIDTEDLKCRARHAKVGRLRLLRLISSLLSSFSQIFVCLSISLCLVCRSEVDEEGQKTISSKTWITGRACVE